MYIYDSMKKVAVIGGGPAGASAGVFLSRSGFDVTVFEKVAEPGPIGAGIMLQRTGRKVLSELGVLDVVEGNGARIEHFRGYNRNGKRVLNLDLRKSGSYGLGAQRGAIFESTFGQLKESFANIITGAEVVDVLSTSTGKVVRLSSNEEVGEFDVVIVANGARSMLRKRFPITRTDKPQKWGALWALLESDDCQYQNSIIHKYSGTTKMLGFMPVGRLDDSAKPKINFFWSIRMSDAAQWKKKQFQDWKEDVITFAPEYEEIIDSLQDREQLTLAPYHDAFLNPMYSDGVFFIGDAAHAMSPQLSAGTNLALLDSWLLSQCFLESKSPEEVATLFHKKRRTQLKYYYKLSKAVTPMFQSDYKLAWVRNVFLGMLLKTPGPSGIFLDTLLGVRKNLFSRINKDWYL